MILPDINVWLALAMSRHMHHDRCVTWFDSIDALGAIRFCRTTQQGFLRLATNRALQAQYGSEPLTNAEAWNAYQQFSADSRIGRLMAEPDSLDAVWMQLSSRATPSPQTWTDTYLAAFAITAGATFITIDRAFTQFPALDLHLIE